MTQYISIKDASELSGKSIQTIRRMIKSKKLRYRKDRTPQGFNYLIEFNSLAEVSKISPEHAKQILGATSQNAHGGVNPAITTGTILDATNLVSEARIQPIAQVSQSQVSQASTEPTAETLVNNSAQHTPAQNTAQPQSAQNIASTQEVASNISADTQTAVAVNLMDRSHQQIVSYEPVKEFNDTMQKLIEQHGKEKENLFRLIETFQNKVISLENKMKVEASSKKSWFKIW